MKFTFQIDFRCQTSLRKAAEFAGRSPSRSHLWFWAPEPRIQPGSTPADAPVERTSLGLWMRKRSHGSTSTLEGSRCARNRVRSDMIRNSIHAPVCPYISFYDGGFPSPFLDKSFDCVYSSEVLEPHSQSGNSCRGNGAANKWPPDSNHTRYQRYPNRLPVEPDSLASTRINPRQFLHSE